MIDGYAAGHSFKEGACETCGMRFFDIQHVTVADIGTMGIAHSGQLTGHEVEQIQKLTKTLRQKILVSFGWRD